jgi:pilus assembly protein CpaB
VRSLNSLRLLNPSQKLQLTDAINRHRRAVAAVLAAVTVLASIAAVKGTRPSIDVLVATRALSAGTVLSESDTALRAVATPLALGASANPSELLGRTLLINVDPGQPLYPSFALDRTSIPRGLAAVPLRTSDPAVANLVRPGERVDVVGQRTSADPPTLLARDLAVLTVAVPKSSGLLKASSEAPLVVVLADSYTAGVLAAASLAAPVALTLRS